jgi:catechol 2,3-dioxygenase-like lactoylglutathione lyase family enzyme
MLHQIRYALGACSLLAFAVFYSTASQEPSRPKILGISHVRIRVSDFCKARDFYSMVLDQHPNCPADKKPTGGSVALHSSQWITLNVNSLNAGSSLNQQSLLEEVGFITDDAAGLQQYLTSRNITAGEVGARPPSFTVSGPEGHRISFIERSTTPAQLRPNLPFQPQIIHAGFVVHDRAAEDHFYKDILGFRLYWHGGMKDDKDDWVAMQVPDGTDWVEYMLNISPTADKHTLGVMNHIALGVEDIHETEKRLIANGWTPGEKPKLGRDGKWQLNLYDPDDTRVEFMEFTPKEKPCCSEFTGPHPGPKQ